MLVLGVLAGCGGSSSNGVASKTPSEILLTTTAAAFGAKSVHVAGALVAEGTPFTLDLDLVAGEGARGEVSEHGLSFQLIELGGTVYINGSPAFYQHFGGVPAVQLFGGRWLKAPANTGEFASLSSLTNLAGLMRSLLNVRTVKPGGAARAPGGHRAVAVRDVSTGETVYVATTGKPYPLAVVGNSSTHGGSISFDHWNAIGTLRPPANAIDIARLERT
jgi:hypothetical protein